MKRRLLGVTAAVLGTVLISGAGMYSSAVAADPVPTTVTLPLFGAAVTFDITTDAGGAITDVAVDPADGTVATKLKPHKVVFKSANPADPTDTARVVIKSGHGGQSVSARAGSLGDVSGAGVWSGDVFGDGVTTTVNFTVGAAADGSPDITGITTSGAAAVVGEVKHSSGDDHEGDESSQSARVSIKFTNTAGDLSRSLSIKVRVHTEDDGDDDDGDSSAKLSISLGRIKGVAEMAVGPHTWIGRLCDNTPASIDYTVAADGTITLGAIAPAGATSETSDHGVKVTFATGERVRIKVSSHHDQLKVSAQEKARCNSADPTTNAEISIPPDNGDHHDGDHHGDGDHKGGHDG
jgi:hypothetical protein